MFRDVQELAEDRNTARTKLKLHLRFVLGVWIGAGCPESLARGPIEGHRLQDP